ncbi:MAG: hypothetical protein WBM47_03590, partial [Polyangiales bacterium]
ECLALDQIENLLFAFVTVQVDLGLSHDHIEIDASPSTKTYPCGKLSARNRLSIVVAGVD